MVVADMPGPAEPVTLEPGMIDLLEADVLGAIEAVGDAATDASAGTTAAGTDLARIRGLVHELADAARAASAETLALAASAEELAATSGEIEHAMAIAQRTLAGAIERAREAGILIDELSRASVEIGGIVDTIASVASQTHLLALNATIEGARAGAAGRGFAVVAAEVKSLSVETTSAVGHIRQRIERLRTSAAASSAGVVRVIGVIADVDPVFGTVQAAVAEQNASIAELARRSADTSTYAARGSERAQQVDLAAGQAVARLALAEQAAARAGDLAGGLRRRFVAVLRHAAAGDRRRFDRLPVEMDVGITVAGRRIGARTVDLGRGGALLSGTTDAALQAGTRIRLDLAEVGTMEARIVGVSALGHHCAFDARDDLAGRRLALLLDGIEAGYRPLIEAGLQAAGRIERALDAALASGELTRDVLFSTRYVAIPGTDPEQFDSPATAILERLLAPIQDGLLAADPQRVFCIATDRNGYVPVHNTIYAQPPRPGDRAWNTNHCRNKRIFDDRAGITAARSTRPFVIQSYPRAMGDGEVVMVREVDVPLRPSGRHWGGLRMAYKL